MKKKEKQKEKEDKEKEAKGTEQLKVSHLKPQDLEIPDVRVDSKFSEDLIDMFKQDIKVAGIQSPLLVAKTEEHLYVIDGKHRLQEALLNGYKTIPCVVRDMNEADMMLRNLVTNRLRGKTPASEEVKVVRHLYQKLGITIEQISKRTGMRRERLEQLINIGSAATSVLSSLDEGRITVCQAFQLSRLPDTNMQLKLLHQIYIAHVSCTDLRDIVNEIQKMVNVVKNKAKDEGAFLPPPVPTAKCQLCEGMYTPRDCVAPIICKFCWARMLSTIDDMRRQAEAEKLEREAKAKAVIESASTGTQEPTTS